MHIYYILFFTLAALAFCAYRKDNKNSRIFFFVAAWILLSLVEGLRAYDVGTDTKLYVGHFMGKEMLRPELGYKVFDGLIKSFSSNPTVLLVCLALLINGIVLAGIYLNSETPIASVLLYMLMYYYFNTYNTARQYIAVAITLVAFYFAVRRRWLFFGIMIALAMCFHSTSIVCITLGAAGLVCGKENEYTALPDSNSAVRDSRSKAMRVQIILMLLTVAASLACFLLLDWFIALAVKIFPKYSYYLTGDESYLLKEGGGISQPVVYTSILLALILFVPAENRYKRKLLVPACIAVIFSFLQMRVLHAARFLWYFDIYSVFTIPCIVKYGIFPERLRRPVIIAAAIVCFVFMTYYLLNDMQGVMNYSFVFAQ